MPWRAAAMKTRAMITNTRKLILSVRTGHVDTRNRIAYGSGRNSMQEEKWTSSRATVWTPIKSKPQDTRIQQMIEQRYLFNTCLVVRCVAWFDEQARCFLCLMPTYFGASYV